MKTRKTQEIGGKREKIEKSEENQRNQREEEKEGKREPGNCSNGERGNDSAAGGRGRGETVQKHYCRGAGERGTKMARVG